MASEKAAEVRAYVQDVSLRVGLKAEAEDEKNRASFAAASEHVALALATEDYSDAEDQELGSKSSSQDPSRESRWSAYLGSDNAQEQLAEESEGEEGELNTQLAGDSKFSGRLSVSSKLAACGSALESGGWKGRKRSREYPSAPKQRHELVDSATLRAAQNGSKEEETKIRIDRTKRVMLATVERSSTPAPTKPLTVAQHSLTHNTTIKPATSEITSQGDANLQLLRLLENGFWDEPAESAVEKPSTLASDPVASANDTKSLLVRVTSQYSEPQLPPPPPSSTRSAAASRLHSQPQTAVRQEQSVSLQPAPPPVPSAAKVTFGPSSSTTQTSIQLRAVNDPTPNQTVTSVAPSGFGSDWSKLIEAATGNARSNPASIAPPPPPPPPPNIPTRGGIRSLYSRTFTSTSSIKERELMPLPASSAMEHAKPSVPATIKAGDIPSVTPSTNLPTKISILPVSRRVPDTLARPEVKSQVTTSGSESASAKLEASGAGRTQPAAVAASGRWAKYVTAENEETAWDEESDEDWEA